MGGVIEHPKWASGGGVIAEIVGGRPTQWLESAVTLPAGKRLKDRE